MKVTEVEVQQPKKEHARQIVVPPTGRLTLPRRLRDRKRRVVQRPLQKILLACKLDLHDELLPVRRRAVQVEARATVLRRLAQPFRLADLQIRDVQAEDAVQRTDQQLLVSRLLEYLSS